MAASAFQTAQNVKFKGANSDAVVLKDSGGIKSLIVCEKVNALDMALLDALITAYGGVTPLGGPIAGKATANFKGTVVGGNATGLVSTAAATAGTATINVGGAKAGGSATGLANSTGTAGSQTVNLAPGKVGADATGLAVTAGFQTVNVGGDKTAASATSLVGGTTYTATVTVDGSGRAISILGSTAQTYGTLLTELNADLGAFATATLSGGNILITSATSGTSSTVAITAGTLFAAPLAGFVSVPAATAGTSTVYTATVTVDGVGLPISISAQAAQTFTTLLAELNTDLGANATATLVGGDIKITSATFGLSSKVVITPGTLFPAIAGYTSLFPSANGDGTARVYSASVVVDGVLKSVNFAGNAAQTYTNLLSQINTDLGASATATISGGNILITSATTGKNSSVVVYDTGLFSALTSFVGITSTAGVAPRVYTATITVDGVAKPIAVQGSAAQTFTALVTEINTDLGASGTAAITGGNIVVTSATTGVASTVVIADGDLFKSVTGFFKVDTPRDGAVDMLAILQRERMPNGTRYSEYFKIDAVGAKPAVLPNTPKNTSFIYHNGTVWKYLSDDTNV